ncbi:hypothetical protein [Microvirga pudoricolor]|uniref:hypothetical protein n=1 Tax=Microvirga pudoricolor TaxID=2778729 RepID=UPI0019500BBC|nr:hypothetical protein [Microvirga pudoricolor]MBM6593094.1 hypothetical protein [Microvirga pudoricolor]
MLALDAKPALDGDGGTFTTQDAINNIPREYTARYGRIVADLAGGSAVEVEAALTDGAALVERLKGSNDPQNIRAADFLEGTMDAVRIKRGSAPDAAYNEMRDSLSNAWNTGDERHKAADADTAYDAMRDHLSTAWRH